MPKIPNPIDLIPSLSGLSDFIKNILELGKIFVKICGDLTKIIAKIFKAIDNPWEAFLFVFQLIFAMMLLFFYVVWQFLRILFIFILLVISTLLSCFIFCLYCVFIFVCYLFDASIFRGWVYPIYYRLIGSCENSPNAWFENIGYQRRNINDGFHFRCGDNYIPDEMNSSSCKRLSSSEPRFCPYPNIYRTYKNKSVKQTLYDDNFHPSHNMTNVTGRRREISEFMLNSMLFRDSCETYMRPYSQITESICKSLNMGVKRSKLHGINKTCFDSFCTNGMWSPFCNKLSGRTTDTVTDVILQKKYDAPVHAKIYFNVLFISILIMICQIMILKIQS
jgi:hypothetical protein